MIDECPHGMEDPSWCSTCKHGPERNEPDKIDYAFTAKYEGHCTSCDLPIYIGQRAAKMTKGRVIHEDCAR